MQNKQLSEFTIKEQLVDSSRIVIELVAAGIGSDKKLFGEAVNLAFNEKPPVSSRAARVVELCTEKRSTLLLPYLDTIIHNMPECEGSKRSFLKILAVTPFHFTENQMGILVDSCFEWLQSEIQPVSIKVYSMKILARIAESEPDLIPELISVIEDQMPRGSSGIKAQGRKILKNLRRKSL